MNAEVADNKHIDMVGGHSDFMRGCIRSPGGRGIVALHSTARGASISRMTPTLSGSIITTARSYADFVVTEHGVAELRGRSVSERARQLIATSHLGFRSALTNHASKGLM